VRTKLSGGEIKPRSCEKYFELKGIVGLAVPHGALACKPPAASKSATGIQQVIAIEHTMNLEELGVQKNNGRRHKGPIHIRD
jgi:hypothetical protein